MIYDFAGTVGKARRVYHLRIHAMTVLFTVTDGDELVVSDCRVVVTLPAIQRAGRRSRRDRCDCESGG